MFGGADRHDNNRREKNTIQLYLDIIFHIFIFFVIFYCGVLWGAGGRGREEDERRESEKGGEEGLQEGGVGDDIII